MSYIPLVSAIPLYTETSFASNPCFLNDLLMPVAASSPLLKNPVVLFSCLLNNVVISIEIIFFLYYINKDIICQYYRCNFIKNMLYNGDNKNKEFSAKNIYFFLSSSTVFSKSGFSL